jgi:hypothetical protein
MELFTNENQWPTLASSIMKQKKDSDATVAPNDWEILDDDLHTPETEMNTGTQPPSGTTTGFVVVEDDSHEILSVKHDRSSLSSSINAKQLRHSVSSPILSGRTTGSDAVITEITDSTQMTTTLVLKEHEDLDDSFSIVSDVASVWTATSTAVKSSMTVSFRDAILLSSPTTEQTTTSYRTVAASAIQPTTNTQRSPIRQPRTRIQPKIVVVQSPSTPLKNMRRCSKSTGDLLGLTISEEFDMSNATGISSATTQITNTDRFYEDEVYYHKAMGATSRMNSLKLRVDEAQRKAMILYKKDRQRQSSAMNEKNKAVTAIGKV